MAGSALTPTRAIASEAIEFVRTIPDLTPATRLIADTAARSMVAFENPENAQTTLRLRILNGDRLSTTLERRIDGHVLSIPPIYAFDPSGRRLYVLTYRSLAEQIAGTGPHLVAIDVRTLRPISDRPLDVFPAVYRVRGLGYSQALGRLHAVAQFSPVTAEDGNHSVAIAEIDPASNAATWPSPGYIAIPQCQKIVGSSTQSAVTYNDSEHRVFIGCGTGRVFTVTQPGIPAVAAVDVTDPAHPATSIYQVAGNYVLGESRSDDVAGRFIMVSSSVGSPTQAAYVFDEASASYLGVVSAGNSSIEAVGLNPVLGHLYVSTNQGLLVTAHTGIDVPQALSFDVKGAAPGVVTDIPFNGSFLVPVNAIPGDLSSRVVVKLYRDRLPEFTEPVENPDASTIDVKETPGKTSMLFNAEAAGFGLRFKEVGGLNGALQNAVPSEQNYWRAVHQPLNLNDGLSDGDRYTYAGRVARSRVSNDEAGARSVSLDPDDSTGSDFGTLGQGTPWPYDAAHCSDLGAGATEGKGKNAAASCDRAHGRVDASAEFRDASIQDLVSVAWSTSTTQLSRPPGGGIAAVITGEARGITLGSDVTIGKIASRAEVTANGRIGGAKAVLVQTFENVRSPAYSCSTSCDLSAVLRAVSSALGSTFRVESPAAQILVTPRGARASVARDPAGQQEDVVFNDQSRVERQVPALRISTIVDNSSRSRIIVELAGVQAVTTYGISRIEDLGHVTAPSAGTPFVTPPVVTQNSTPRRVTKLHPGFAQVLTIPALPWKLLVRKPQLLASLIWAIFAAPVLLGLRRRSLIRLFNRRST